MALVPRHINTDLHYALYRLLLSNTDTRVNVFDDEMQLCTLLNAFGSEGLKVLLAQGLHVSSAEVTLDQVLEALKKT